MNTLERIDAYKAAIDARRPFEGESLLQLRRFYRVGLTWTSNALEGNSLSDIETKILLEDGLTVSGKPIRDTFEAIGHARAYDYMFDLLGSREIGIAEIRTLHKLFYSAIDEDQAGQWRKVQVFLSGSDHRFPDPQELGFLMQDLEQWITSERGGMHPVRFAAMLHLKFIMIHPFIDGNGRVARLMMNTALIQEGYLLAVIPPVIRREYLVALRAYQEDGDTEPICSLIADMVLQSERDIMRLLGIPVPAIE